MVEDQVKPGNRAGQMLDAFFAGELHSLRECYISLTGDRDVTGLLTRCDPVRLRESFGADFIEALDSASWGVALGSAVQRRVHAALDTMTELQAWKKLVKVESVAGFRQQNGVRIGGYGNLPVVAQRGVYTDLASPSELASGYSVAKRGGRESISLEMLVNDDVQAVRRVPAELALAAANTLYEFVFDFLRTNPVIHDGLALFHATHGNLGSAAFTKGAYYAAANTIAKQARPGSGKRIGFGGKALLIPLDLQEAAHDAFVGHSKPPEIIPVPYWTDANDWCVVNDPAYCPTIEIGFLGGKEAPELIIANQPTNESFFSHDVIDYKIRHIYGGTVLDYRGMFKSVVA